MTKTTLITGATAGFGQACARLLAKEKHRLILTGRREDRLQKLKAELGNFTGIHTLCFDVRDNGAVKAAIVGLPKEFSAIDVLVNNAGLALGAGSVPDIEMSDWEQMVDTNIKGLMYCTQAVLSGMVARGDGGHIVNIGSISAHYPYAGGNAYGGTKAFVHQFSRNLRAELLGKPIRVTNIEPGMAETEFSLVRFHGDAEKAKAVYRGIKPLSGEDVAETVRWAIALPAHVNINNIELMPTMQAAGGLAVKREG